MISVLRRILHSRRTTAFGLTTAVILTLVGILPAQRIRSSNRTPPKRTSQVAPIPEVLVMRVDEGKITADIVNCELQKVLRELAERTGIRFEVRTEDNPRISVHLYGVSFQEAIQRIAANNNTMFFYDGEKPERIELVRVFPRTKAVKQPGIVYLGTGTVTKGNDDIATPAEALKVLEEGASVKARERAIEILSQTGSDEAIAALMKSVADEQPEIRMAAIEGLASLGELEALPKIVECLKDRHSGVRQSAVTAVALLGDENNLNDLKALRADKDSGVAAAAETAIQKLSASIER